LTEAGKALFPKMKAISATVQNRFLRGFTKVEVRQLEEFLGRILQNA
jgi:DNA-binding MarR family transcriptional regulator